MQLLTVGVLNELASDLGRDMSKQRGKPISSLHVEEGEEGDLQDPNSI